MSKYISGRYKKTPQSGLTSDRYRYLSPGDAEPNLGDTPSAQGTPNLPTGQQYIIVGFLDRPGERFWIPNQGGIIPGSLSVFDEGNLVGGLSSTTQLDFQGNAIVAEGIQSPQPGVAVTITVAPPGDNNSVLFKNNDDFDTDTKFTFDSGLLTAGDRITVGTGGTVITTTLGGLVGIGTTIPTEELHLDGDFRITGTIYDSQNQPGTPGDILVKTDEGNLLWVGPETVISAAGGTIGQIQFHSSAGLVDGADNFYFDYINNRVGIGSTQPTQLLDVLGISTFSGGVNIDTLTAFENSTFKENLTVDKKLIVDGLADLDELYVAGIATFSDIDANGHTGLGTLTVSGIATFSNELQIDATGTINSLGPSAGVAVTLAGNGGITTTGGDLYVGGDLYIKDDLTFDHLTANTGTFNTSLYVSGILTTTSFADIGEIRITSNIIKSTGVGDNLVLQSDHGNVQINDNVIINSDTESDDKDTGALVVDGGVGIGSNLNVGGAASFTGPSSGVAVTLAAAGGITTTGGDLFVGGDLNVKDKLVFTDLDGQDMVISGIATINQLEIGQPDETLVGITSILDEDTMVSNSDTALATQQSIKAYVDNQFGNVELTFAGDGSTSGTVDLDSQTFTISGTSNEIETSAADQTLTIGLPDNVTVSGNLTVNGNTTLGNDATVDTVSFGSTISSSFIPNTDNSYNIGSTDYKWGTVYATTFDGAFQGTADAADRLTTARTFTLGEVDNGNKTDDIISIGRTFDGTQNVGFALTLTNTNVTAGDYGSSSKVGTFSVDAKGRLTAAADVDIDFAGATVAIAGYAHTAGIATIAGYAHTAGIATNLGGGQAYQIPYQSNANETSFISTGSSGQLLQYNESAAPSWVTVGELSVGTAETANNLSGGAAGSIPYQDGPGSTLFLAEPNANGYVLHYNNTSDAPEWKELSTFTGVGIGVAASATDVLNVNNGNIGGVDTDADKIVFYDDSESKLTYLTVGTGLTITDTTISASYTDTNTTYDLETQANGDDIDLKLVDSDSTTAGIVTITAGSNITLTDNGNGFTIDATGGSGAGTLTDVEVKQFSDNNTPRTEYACTNPIDVDVSVGIVTIGIGSVSNAYGKRYIGPTEPTVDVCDGDIWYDTSTGGGDAAFTSDPVGTIVAWSGTVANIPTGYQLCNGGNAQSLELQNIVGTNVPDLRDKFVVGATSDSATGVTFNVVTGEISGNYAPGNTGGSVAHQLTINEMPSHTHTYDKSLSGNNFGGDGQVVNQGTSSTNTGSRGGSHYHENRPPYYALCYIIKYGASNTTIVGVVDKISEGNTEAEVVDTGSDGHFKVSTEGVERLRIDHNGNVGIGTTTPIARLDVRGGIVIDPLFDSLDMDGSGAVSSLDGGRFNAGWFPPSPSIENSEGNAGLHFLRGDIQQTVVGLPQYSGGFALFARNSTYDYADNFISAQPSRGIRIAYSSGIFELLKSAQYGSGVPTPILKIEPTDDNLLFDGGNVGIGFTIFGNGTSPGQPTAKLHVNGTVAIGSSLYDSNGNTGTEGQVLSSVPGIGVSWTDQTGGSGSSGGSSNYESSILSLNGTNQVEFTDIPSWATKVTLIAENILLPHPNANAVGSLLEFGGSSGYLAANSYAYNLHYGLLDNNDSYIGSITDSAIFNNTPYADFILLYGSGYHQNYPILSQVFITFQKVKGQNKWVFEGSVSNRKGDPSTSTIDQKWLNNFTGSFTATEAITKLKLYNYEGAQYAASNTNYTGGSVTAIYEGEGSSSSSGGGSLVKLGTVATTSGTEAAFTGIPSTAKKITISIHRFSYSGTNSDLIMEVGDSGGYYNSAGDYQSSFDNRDESPNARGIDYAYGLLDDTLPDREYNINIELVNVSGNNWTITHTGGNDDIDSVSPGAICYGGGSVSLSNALDKLRIRTYDNRTFDNGEISVYYETASGAPATNEGTDAGQGFFTNDTTLTTNTTLPSNKNVGIFGPYTIGNNVTLTVPTGTTFTVV